MNQDRNTQGCEPLDFTQAEATAWLNREEILENKQH